MTTPSPLPTPSDALARRPAANAITLPTVPAISPNTPLRYIDAPVEEKSGKDAKGKDAPVLRGLKDLQQLQKQTIAVLENLQGSLDDIHQVLRSPEATRGLEKQKNAATLLSKGFAREAVEQAIGAVELLPANPETHLLLALSLASDHQLDSALAAARKGLALVDRRQHPLAIEAGLLHALASLGANNESLERWGLIIDSLPLPVLLEQLPLIAACFPANRDAPPTDPANLDHLLANRITRGRLYQPAAPHLPRQAPSLLDTKPSQIPPSSLLAGIDAAHASQLSLTHRAILVLFAQRLNAQMDAADVVRFISECIVPLGERKLKSASTLARTCVKRLHRFHADAPTLHRAMTKLQLAGTHTATRRIATLLAHWRNVALQASRTRRVLTAAATLIVAGGALSGYLLMAPDLKNGKAPSIGPVSALHFGFAVIGLGSMLGLWRLLARPVPLQLPNARPALSKLELRFLQSNVLRQSLRSLPRSRSASITQGA